MDEVRRRCGEGKEAIWNTTYYSLPSSPSYSPPSSLSLKRSDSIAENVPEALQQSRYQMKRCFTRYVMKGKRLMKNRELIEEMEKSVDDEVEKERLMEGFLGYIIFSTRVTKYQMQWQLLKIGGSNISTIFCICYQTESWDMGICQSECRGSCSSWDCCFRILMKSGNKNCKYIKHNNLRLGLGWHTLASQKEKHPTRLRPSCTIHTYI